MRLALSSPERPRRADKVLVCAGEFRLIIFRPYIGEALVGKVKSQSPEGIVGASARRWMQRWNVPQLTIDASAVSVGFFDDILVPPNLLPDWSA